MAAPVAAPKPAAQMPAVPKPAVPKPAAQMPAAQMPAAQMPPEALAPLTAEEQASEAPRRNVPKGLRNLLRGRQTQLPLETENPPAPAEPDPLGESAFASLERREGFFELRAGENQRDDASKRFRSPGLDRP
jgi:hypothetical protein